MMNTEQLRRKLERLAIKKFGPRGQDCPDVKVVVVNEKAGTCKDYDISEVGLGEPGQIVIFVNENEILSDEQLQKLVFGLMSEAKSRGIKLQGLTSVEG